MLPIDADPTTIAAVALVVVLGITRTYFGSAVLSTRFARFWGLARRLYMPVLDRIAKRAVGVGAENHATRAEHVADLPASVLTVIRELNHASDPAFEVSVLSGLKTDWAGNTEAASVVAYVGPKPFPGAPRWLRAEQVHVFMFRANDVTRVCAHREANAWRPDQWRDHLRKGPSFDVSAGVDAVREWLVASGVSLPT